jgi:hypothetical protein
MNNFATPETDAEELVQMGSDWKFVNVEFARQLERERDLLRAAMGLIAEDCTAWLHAENDLPAVDFVKAVRDYATTYSLQPSNQ